MEYAESLKKIVVMFGVIAIFFISFFGNVYLHEFGHYAAADSFDLNPSMNFEKIDESFNGFEMKAIAYTEFDYSSSDSENFIIAIMGPLMNLILCLFFLFMYVYWRDNEMVGIIALAGLIPSLFSFIMNILPFAGADGEVILKLLVG